jgi:hypothetical protein
MASIKPEGLQEAIADMLREYGDIVYNATDEGLEASQKVLIEKLKSASSQGATKRFRSSWKGKKYSRRGLSRYVHNTKMVKGAKGDIPLSNILEYSEKSPHRGFVKRTFDSSINEMAAAAVAIIKKEV